MYNICLMWIELFISPKAEGQCGEGWPSAAEHPEGDRSAGGAVPGHVWEHGESDHSAGGTHGTWDGRMGRMRRMGRMGRLAEKKIGIGDFIWFYRVWLDDDVDLRWIKQETWRFTSSKMEFSPNWEFTNNNAEFANKDGDLRLDDLTSKNGDR